MVKMLRNKHLCVIGEGYPYADDPQFTFVAQLVETLADLGVRCSVIAPQSVSKQFVRKRNRRPEKWTHITHSGNQITIYQPKVLSVSNLRIRGVSISYWLVARAMRRVLCSMEDKPDICYGHFWHSAYAVFREAKRLDIPLFVATGESVISLPMKVPLHDKQAFSGYLSGVFCVSKKNKQESIKLGLAHEEQCIVLPNGIDAEKFHYKDKKECRAKIGVSDKAFVVAFVGAFIPRKGANRVSDAISQLNDNNIKSFFIGSAPDGESRYSPSCKGIEFCGKLNHDQIIDYLNAADVFVLPTLQEGCCNAIIEAMACGLPIISSALPFNDDILNEDNSIRIDPNNINSIANAIRVLKEAPEKCTEMGAESLKTAKSLQIEKRAQEVLSFMELCAKA